MTSTKNYKELSKKRKKAGLSKEAWLFFGLINLIILLFDKPHYFLLSSLITYCLFFLLERYDPDIFIIIFTKIKKNMPKKFYC